MLKFALLGLLSRSPLHGYDLKRDLELILGGNWEINFGQIYTTLGRLERDGWVKVVSEDEDGRGKKTYALTESGRRELLSWLVEIVEKPRALRDEFFIKLLIAQTAGVGDVHQTIDRQRRAYLRQLRDLAAILKTTEAPQVQLMVEGAILHLQADLQWIDLCDERMAKETPRVNW